MRCAWLRWGQGVSRSVYHIAAESLLLLGNLPKIGGLTHRKFHVIKEVTFPVSFPVTLPDRSFLSFGKLNLRTKSAITIHDVAAAAGVSVTTVSRVLNDKDDVAPETSARVREVIRELGYASSLAARSLRSRRSNVIGVIVPDLVQYYSLLVVRGIQRTAREAAYDVLV